MKEDECISADIEYVMAHLCDPETLTDAEFLSWLSEPEHLQLFETVRRDRQTFLMKEERMKVDITCEWGAFSRQIKPVNRNWIWWCSAAACVVMAVVGVWKFKVQEPQPQVVAQQEIPVARRCAELILADGKAVALDKKELQIRDQSGALIRNDAEQRLIYTAADGAASGPVANNTLKVPAGADYFVQLEDGSRVWVNCESELEFPVRFDEKERRVILRGEAYFEVNKAEAWPFIVVTDRMEVRVTGTSFNVKAYVSEKMMHATLVSGRVEVSREGQRQILKPSEQYCLDTETGKSDVVKVETEVFTGWKDGVFVFRNSLLEDVVNSLARWYRMEVFYARPSARKLRFSGNLDRYENIDQLLEVINANGQVVLTRDKGVLIVN